MILIPMKLIARSQYFLPLTLPTLQTAGRAPLAVVIEKLGAAASDERLKFIESAEVGPEKVREWLRRYIDDAAIGDLSEASESD